ncbi:MAG: hypothetical protein ACOVN4_04410 [Bosea sp. (in: a-proteobacteria)]
MRFHETMRAGSRNSGKAEKRTPIVVDANGKTTDGDPRGYWQGPTLSPCAARCGALQEIIMTANTIARIILAAMHDQIDPTVDDVEARVREQGYVCCHALTVRAGADKAAQFAADMAALVARHNKIVTRAHGTRGEYRAYLLQQAEELRHDLFAWTSGDSEIVTACGHNTVPIAKTIDALLATA